MPRKVMTQEIKGFVTPELTKLWYDALESEFGIEVIVSHPDVERDLYAARKLAADPRLQEVRLCRMAGGELWLVKNGVTLTGEIVEDARPST